MAAMTPVTLVHTDIQGSTRLWERAPAAMRLALAQHDAFQRQEIADHGGYEVRTEGDAFLVAFENAIDAIGFCLSLQDRLVGASWPVELLEQDDARHETGNSGESLWSGPRVRMGAHQGLAETAVDPTTQRRTYHGPLVHRCIAVASAAHGGQILTSRELWQSLKSQPGIGLDLGHHRLPDQSSGIDLVQVCSESLQGRGFPPVRSLSEERSNLSKITDATIGQQRQLETLIDALMNGDRCQALVGTAGVGKSRLAQLATAATTHAFRSGAWLIELAGCSSEADLLQAVASTLSIPLTQSDMDEQIAVLGRAIDNRGRLLLLFDNADRCDQALTKMLPLWLKESRGLFTLLTSRKLPSVDGCTTHRIAPLSTDEGVELFLKRTRERRAKLNLDNEELAACHTIVEALDGLPLAIELAASRVGILTPKRIADRLNERFRLLQKRTRDDDRQATLGAALDWSWQTLSPDSQRYLAQLSVFRDGFNVGAAAAVCGIDVETIQEQIAVLVDQSMVQSVVQGTSVRFQLFESIRLFAADQYGTTQSLEELGAAHARYFGNLGLQVYFQSQTADLPKALARIRVERANLLAAFEYSCSKAPEHAAGAALGLVPHLFTQGPVPLGNELFIRLSADADKMSATTAALFLNIVARIRMSLGDHELSLRTIKKAHRSAIASGVENLVALVNETHVRLLSVMGEVDKAKALIREGLGHVRAKCSKATEARLHAAIGNFYYRIGRTDSALEAFVHSAQVFGDLGMGYPHAQSLGNAGLIHVAQRRFEAAEECFLICLRHYEAMRNLGEQALVHGYLGLLALDRDDLEGAAQHYHQSIETGRRIAKDEPIVIGLGYLGVIAQLRGRTDQALIRFEESMSSARSGSTARVEAYFRCYHAGLLSTLGRMSEAESNWQRSGQILEQASDPSAVILLRLTRAQAWCRDDTRQAELQTLINSMREPDEHGISKADGNEDIRFALRLLELG